jgi:methylenetetrahydrofolate dehydrogenase (NADP+)/methenyltetrahydrofolate cyclohydrolase
MHLIDGKEIATQIQNQIAKAISGLTHRKPGLAFVQVGNDPASLTYIRMKKKRCDEVGILSFDCILPASISEKELIHHINKLNHDTGVDGILVQLPLPEHINTMRIMSAIDPAKDVD